MFCGRVTFRLSFRSSFCASGGTNSRRRLSEKSTEPCVSFSATHLLVTRVLSDTLTAYRERTDVPKTFRPNSIRTYSVEITADAFHARATSDFIATAALFYKPPLIILPQTAAIFNHQSKIIFRLAGEFFEIFSQFFGQSAQKAAVSYKKCGFIM